LLVEDGLDYLLQKALKNLFPKQMVIIVEKREFFFSCPVSNAWMFDMVNMEFLTHSYIDASNNHNYTYIQAEAIDLDKKNSILYTNSMAAY